MQAEEFPHEVTHASERALHYADKARKQAQHLPHDVQDRLHKSKSKRFIFA